MNAALLSADRDDLPREDHFVVLHGVSWADYQRVLKIRGDQSAPRLAYVEGELEIMSPSKNHEAIKSILGCLVEVFCLEANVEFSTYGSWTLKNKRLKLGVEPDECYVFGPAREALRPDLAIEVMWTSGGIEKLDIYRALSVREVWCWRRGEIVPYVVRGKAYQQVPRSEVLAGIDLAQLARFLGRPTTSQAIREYRAALRKAAATR